MDRPIKLLRNLSALRGTNRVFVYSSKKIAVKRALSNAEHQNIKITHRKTGQGTPYHQDFLTKLAAGSGLADVQALEEGHLSDFIDKSDKPAHRVQEHS